MVGFWENELGFIFGFDCQDKHCKLHVYATLVRRQNTIKYFKKPNASQVTRSEDVKVSLN